MVWIAYAAVYAGGFVGVMSLTRTSSYGWAALSLPFAFPVALVGAGLLAAQHGAKVESRREPGERSPLGGHAAVIRREPMRWTTAVAWTMMTPFFAWIFPRDTPPFLRLIFVGWWLACTAFTGFLLPRLMKVTRL